MLLVMALRGRQRYAVVANLLRVRLDVIAQCAAGEELRRLADELEGIKAVMAAHMEERQLSWR